MVESLRFYERAGIVTDVMAKRPGIESMGCSGRAGNMTDVCCTFLLVDWIVPISFLFIW
tara:strand:+ start:526 stop:702 length:177 start_codon:yes stop_codon:yes gene_type:complete